MSDDGTGLLPDRNTFCVAKTLDPLCVICTTNQKRGCDNSSLHCGRCSAANPARQNSAPRKMRRIVNPQGSSLFRPGVDPRFHAVDHPGLAQMDGGDIVGIDFLPAIDAIKQFGPRSL